MSPSGPFISRPVATSLLMVAIVLAGLAADHIEMLICIKLSALLRRQPLSQKRQAAFFRTVLAEDFLEALVQYLELAREL